MKKHVAIVISLITLFFCTSVFAAPQPFMPIPTPPTLNAKAYVLQDPISGKIITSSNADMRVDPASLTKMMTAYVIDQELASGRLHLTDKVRISENAWRMDGSRMFVKVNDEVPVEDLMKGIIIQSGNDASVAMAEHIAGSEDAFAQLMNHYAQQLGMTNTHFMNATGLPHPDHYTTADDMAKLARAIVTSFPDSYPLYAQKEFYFNNIKQTNRNLLLWRDQSVDGIKTGHTDAAGFCLVASAKRDGMRLDAVIMGAPNEASRAEQAQKLLNYGFRFFKTKSIFDGNKPLVQAHVYSGSTPEVLGGVTQPIFITVAQGQPENFDLQVQMIQNLKAPIRKGDTIGTYTLKLNDQVLSEAPVVALNDVDKGGIWRRFIDWMKLLFKSFMKSSADTAVRVDLDVK